MTEILDLRDRPDPPPPLVRGDREIVKHKIVDGLVLKRPIESITGITIHQTAVEFSPTRAALARFPTRRRALAERAMYVACHALAFEDFGVLTAPIDWYVWHGNGFNARDLGLEIEGSYPGIERNRRPRHTSLTERRVETSCETLRALVEAARAEGAPIEFVHAHRQSSRTRRSDPGEALWRAVVLDFAVPELGLTVEPELRIGTGRTLPVQWGGRGRF